MAKGNREALLAGAKACLVERGFDGTTVRDIAAAAGGVSMAAIGYHFGSREALLTEALVGALEEWGSVAQDASASEEPMSVQAYARLWDRLLATSAEHVGLWRASWEVLLRKERDPALAARLADGQEEGRRGVAAWLTSTTEEEIDDSTVRALGSVQMALMSGLVAQRILDPERAPSGEQIVVGLRLLARRLEERGREQGLEQGREQGRQEGRALTLIRLIRLKFGAMPESVESRVRQGREDELERWTERTLTADSIEALFI